jgi:hypothetical protein
MNENYHKSARTQGAQFLGEPKSTVENQRLSASCERDAGATGEATPVNPSSWTCQFCGEPLRLIRVYPSGRGFEMRCEGTDSNPHRLTVHVAHLRKSDVLRLLGGVPTNASA